MPEEGFVQPRKNKNFSTTPPLHIMEQQKFVWEVNATSTKTATVRLFLCEPTIEQNVINEYSSTRSF